ncbi:MAG: hypothetical protein ACJ8R9_21535 [Steroidobacteraceae bacterium]
MRTNSARVLICAAVVCSAAAVSAPQRVVPAESWLARLPPLPTSAAAAYAQWIDASEGLKPGPQFEKVREGIKSEVLLLSRAVERPTGIQGPLSRHDQVLMGRIAVFPGTATVLQNIQAARTSQAALTQKWNADLHALEQRRLRERGALPACHNEASAPSQLAIREVELAYVEQKTALAARYLQQFQPVLQQLLAAVSPRITHGDAVMQAWEELQSPGAQAQLEPVARASEADALLDVGLVQDFVQAVSKLAARPVADRKAIERVYARAKGC